MWATHCWPSHCLLVVIGKYQLFPAHWLLNSFLSSPLHGTLIPKHYTLSQILQLWRSLLWTACLKWPLYYWPDDLVYLFQSTNKICDYLNCLGLINLLFTFIYLFIYVSTGLLFHVKGNYYCNLYYIQWLPCGLSSLSYPTLLLL